MVVYSMIAALSENYVIADDDGIPWHIPEDLEHYERTIEGHLTVCGRKTYEGIPVVPGRESIVITSQEDYDTGNENAYVANSISEAISMVEDVADEDEIVYIIGGETIYSAFLDEADRMVLSHVHGEYEGDTKFPRFNRENWNVEDEESHEKFDIKWYRRISSN